MRVVLVTWFPRDAGKPHGGVEAVSVNLTAALARQPGLDVHVVTVDRGCRESEESRWAGATIHRLPAAYGSLLKYSVGAGRRQVQRFLATLRPDVVHAHDTYGLMVKGLTRPRVFTVHGFIHEDTRYEGGRYRRLRSWLWRWFERAGWADQPHIISISPYVRERLRGVARGMIHDIENPISAECFEVRREEQPGIVFCAAAICQRKNTLGLVRAVQQLRGEGVEVRLRWAGTPTEPEYDREVRQFVHRHSPPDTVTFLGGLPASQIRVELARASVFALASFEEGAPMGIAEAMAAGLPVLTSNRCGMPYMVRDGETGCLVDPGDRTAMVEALRGMLTDSTARSRMGEQGCRAAAEWFHPDRVAQRTLRVYRKILAESNWRSRAPR